jgi:hypothetical protein
VFIIYWDGIRKSKAGENDNPTFHFPRVRWMGKDVGSLGKRLCSFVDFEMGRVRGAARTGKSWVPSYRGDNCLQGTFSPIKRSQQSCLKRASTQQIET